MKRITRGMGHEVFLSDDGTKVYKYPNSKYFDLNRVEEDIEYFKEKFLKFFPNTILIKDGESYVVIQDYIGGANPVKKGDFQDEAILKQLNEILSINNSCIEKDGIGIDFIGLVGSVKICFFLLNKYRGTFLEKYFILFLLKIIDYLNSVFKLRFIPENLTDIWQSNPEPEIGNILVSGGDRLHLVDVSLIRLNDSKLKERIRSKIIQKWNKYFMEKVFSLYI